jgi:hypothetical protein
MKTTEILTTEVPIRSIKHCIAVKRLLAVTIGTLLMACAPSRADAQVYSQNAVGYVSDMTTHLLTARLTTAERQALHAKNFNQLAPSARVLYLFAVAFEMGIMVRSDDGQPLSSEALAEYLQTASMTGGISAGPENPTNEEAISRFDDTPGTWTFEAYKAVVKEAMRELNAPIAPQVSNNTIFQQAMDAGAGCSFDVDFGWDPA